MVSCKARLAQLCKQSVEFTLTRKTGEILATTKTTIGAVLETCRLDFSCK